jgi:acetolactate decarboxylase
MKKVYSLLAVTLLFLASLASACSNSPVDREVLFQTSTFSALLAGIYDGNMTFQELKTHGDFGTGTFNDLDGEMVELEGAFYQIKADGIAYPVDDSMKTPFSVVTFFDADKSVISGNVSDYTQLEQYLDSLLPTENIFYAIKIEGVFDYIKARSVPRQVEPYPPLAEAVKSQSIFEFHDVAGTIVGFRCPSYVGETNVAGYHLHFLTADRKAGGHLFGCQMRNVKVEIDYTPGFYMALPGDSEFYNADLTGGNQTGVEKQ